MANLKWQISNIKSQISNGKSQILNLKYYRFLFNLRINPIR
jgi:hypothetical protein